MKRRGWDMDDMDILNLMRSPAPDSASIADFLKKKGVKHQKMLGMLIEKFSVEYPSVLFIDVGKLKKIARFLSQGKGFKTYKPDAILGNKRKEEIWLEVEEDRFNIFKKIVRIGYLSPPESELPAKVVFLGELPRERRFLDVCEKLWNFFKIKSGLEIFDFEFFDYSESESGFGGKINREKIEKVFFLPSRGIKEKIPRNKSINKKKELEGKTSANDVNLENLIADPPPKEPVEWGAYAVVTDNYESKRYLRKPSIQKAIKEGRIIVLTPDSELGKRIIRETGQKKFPIGVNYCPKYSPTGWVI